MSKSIFKTGYMLVPVKSCGKWYVEIIKRGAEIALKTENHATRELALERAREWLNAKPIRRNET